MYERYCYQVKETQ